MRVDSIQSAKADIWAAIKQRSGISAFSTGSPVISVGMTHKNAKKRRPGYINKASDHLALILAPNADTARIAEDAIGHTECEVVIMPDMATARVTKDWLQQTRDPLEIGCQYRPRGANFVGSGGIATPDGVITNRHVAGMDSRLGREMRQGNRRVGEVAAMGEIDPNDAHHDVAIIEIDEGVEMRLRWDWGLLDNVAGIRSVRSDEIGDPATVTGQTDGTQHGILWATNVDNYPVNYGDFVAWFSDQILFLDPKGGSFSLPGYSGSSIHMMSDKHCVALLFNGGPDAQGRDITGSSDMPGAISWAGGRVELA